MKSRQLEGLSLDIESLLAVERLPIAESDEVRLRALARARAAMTLGPVIVANKPPIGLFRWALATGAGVTLTILAASLWLRGTAIKPSVPPNHEIRTESPALLSPVATDMPTPIAARPAEEVLAPAASAPAHHRAPAPTTADQEVALLQPAQSALARGDLGTALAAIDEHQRRFPNGQLAEEREALRVQTLSAMGRRSEAHRAAVAFANRFPASVLLPGIDRELLVP